MELAAALATKIGKAITKFNSSRLSHIDPKSGTKDLWSEVRRLTKATNIGVSYPPNFSADLLNFHYANISSDPSYTTPPLKATTFFPQSPISEQAVFILLDKLKATSSGHDEIPFLVSAGWSSHFLYSSCSPFQLISYQFHRSITVENRIHPSNKNFGPKAIVRHAPNISITNYIRHIRKTSSLPLS